MNRRRSALLVLAIALLGAWYFFQSGGVVAREITYDLGPGHPEVTRLVVRYRDGARLVRESVWTFDEGRAPRQVAHEVPLPPRTLEVTATVAHDDRVETLRRTYDASEGGATVIHLGSP